MLSITASGPGLDYQAEALLPCAVADKAREQSFRNGVLEAALAARHAAQT